MYSYSVMPDHLARGINENPRSCNLTWSNTHKNVPTYTLSPINSPSSKFSTTPLYTQISSISPSPALASWVQRTATSPARPAPKAPPPQQRMHRPGSQRKGKGRGGEAVQAQLPASGVSVSKEAWCDVWRCL